MRRFVWARRGKTPPHYELLFNDGVLGSLAWVQGSRTTAVAEMAGGVMVFRRKGLLHRHFVIENLREEAVASISLFARGNSGELQHPSGATYAFGFDEALEWSDEQGRILARVGESDLGGGFVTEESTLGQPLPLLLAFAGWYLYRAHAAEQATGRPFDVSNLLSIAGTEVARLPFKKMT
ncbi:MAG: hypothetical protein AB1428_02765 [Bacteroidota bacterium]